MPSDSVAWQRRFRMAALSGLCTAVRSLFGGPDSALSPEPDCTPDALAMHRHSLRPDLFPLVEPDSDYFFYDCDSDLGRGAVGGAAGGAAAGGGSGAGDGGGAGGAGDAGAAGDAGDAAAPSPAACSECASLSCVMCRCRRPRCQQCFCRVYHDGGIDSEPLDLGGWLDLA